jgi:hypothetical protein
MERGANAILRRRAIKSHQGTGSSRIVDRAGNVELDIELSCPLNARYISLYLSIATRVSLGVGMSQFLMGASELLFEPVRLPCEGLRLTFDYRSMIGG